MMNMIIVDSISLMRHYVRFELNDSDEFLTYDSPSARGGTGILMWT